jgi:hypothetical protein
MSATEAEIGAALDQVLAGRWPPASWRPARSLDDLPWRLGQIATALPAGSWRAYSDGACLAFACGEPAGERDIAVRFYDVSARLCAAGVWSPGADGRWQLSQVID